MPASDLQLVLAMPAYNEQDCIESVVAGWDRELSGRFGEAYRIVVVNDGSRDETGTILDRMADRNPRLIVVHQPNGGHGKALLAGYRRALELDPQFVFQTDSDDQFVPGDFGRLWDRRGGSAFILGYRQKRQDALHRLVITRILRGLIALGFGTHIRDSNIPYRLIRAPFLRALLAALPPGEELFAPNIFLSVLADRSGQDVMSIPITHVVRRTGQVSIVRWKLIKVCFRSARELLAFRRAARRELPAIRRVGEALRGEQADAPSPGAAPALA